MCGQYTPETLLLDTVLEQIYRPTYLCVQNDRGVGVVCSGRLCGVVSKSLGDAGAVGAEGCGYTHAVQSLPRWRRFLHCAHSQYGCRS